MSELDCDDGATFYRLMNDDGRKWLRAQLAERPFRVNPANTTNIAFLHGAYRAWIDAGNLELQVSTQLKEHFDYLEKPDD